MKLSSNPFHPVSGELLPAYRDAYLRGDLSSKNTDAVDAYIKANSQLGDETLQRYYELKQQGHQVKPVGWVQRQFELVRTEPQRFRQRAASLVAVGALIGSAVFAGSNLPSDNLPTDLPASMVDVTSAEAGASSALRMTTVRGRILDENGKPLIGATVLQKGSHRGVGTDADGKYALRIPVGQTATLQYGYAGYGEEEISVRAGAIENVTLVPRDEQAAPKKRRWFIF